MVGGLKQIAWLAALALLLSACGSTPPPTPRGVKVGKPYSISGQTYYPEYDPHYDKTGTASWYGPGFHGKSTANGERFNQDDLTAAHPTLPMPSLVRVTNLENGKSQVVRINDRGPFKDNRIIDLSRASARALDIHGLAKVRVQYLKEDTDELWASMNLITRDIQFAKTDPYAPRNRGGLDGIIIPEDSNAPSQGGAPAPLTEVASTDLPPPDMKPRSAQRFSIIGEAEASEMPAETIVTSKPTSAKTYSGEMAIPLNKQVASNSKQDSPKYKIVQLYGKDGKPLSQKGQADVMMTLDAPAGGRAAEDDDNSLFEEEEIASAGPVNNAVSDASARRNADVDGGGWYVQAGSFSSQENARQFAARVRHAGPAEVSTVDVQGKTWHRVRIGPFAARSEAESALERITGDGASGARLIRN